jgi:uncharacterized membrane protein YhaH (DUF805 family)
MGRRAFQQHNQNKNMSYYIAVLKKYAVFSGRARRKEYWLFILFNTLAIFCLAFIQGLAGLHVDLASIYDLAVLLPVLGVSIRRMHDANHSGWWILLPIVNLIFACEDGTKGENRFGPDPKAVAAP